MKINITAIVAINGGEQTCVCIEISEGEHTDKQKFVLLTTQYTDLRIKKGEIDRERFDEIARASAVCSAYKKGLFILGYGACSEKKLHYKLKTKGFDNDISAEAVAMLSREGYLDEESDSVREAEKCTRKLWGRKRIISHLYSKGFREDAIKEASEALCDVDFVENCKTLILRDHNRQFFEALNDRAAMTKLVASLTRMGYSFSEIKEASAAIAADSTDDE